jgi:hypothetical protein
VNGTIQGFSGRLCFFFCCESNEAVAILLAIMLHMFRLVLVNEMHVFVHAAYLVEHVFFDGYVLEFTEGFKNITKKELVRFVRHSICLKIKTNRLDEEYEEKVRAWFTHREGGDKGNMNLVTRLAGIVFSIHSMRINTWSTQFDSIRNK